MRVEDLKKGDKIRYLGRKLGNGRYPHNLLKVGDVVRVKHYDDRSCLLKCEDTTGVPYIICPKTSKWAVVKEEENKTMKKSDLVVGKHIVETQGGVYYLVLEGDILSRVDGDGWHDLKGYSDSLVMVSRKNCGYDIKAAYTYEINSVGGFNIRDPKFYTKVWERNPSLKEEQKELEELARQSEELATRMKTLKDKMGG